MNMCMNECGNSAIKSKQKSKEQKLLTRAATRSDEGYTVSAHQQHFPLMVNGIVTTDSNPIDVGAIDAVILNVDHSGTSIDGEVAVADF